MADLSELRKEFEKVDKQADENNKVIMTLKETSRGGKNKNEFLCESIESVYNFEKYVDFKEKIEKNSNFKGKRFDALYMHDNILYCIEFKIERCANINKQEIDEKFLDSFEILKYIFRELHLQIRDYTFNFYVVFKDFENFFARRKVGDKCSLALQHRLVSLKKIKFSNLTININTDCKSGFLQIYNQIFNTKY